MVITPRSKCNRNRSSNSNNNNTRIHINTNININMARPLFMVVRRASIPVLIPVLIRLIMATVSTTVITLLGVAQVLMQGRTRLPVPVLPSPLVQQGLVLVLVLVLELEQVQAQAQARILHRDRNINCGSRQSRHICIRMRR